jgi:hypothetical protein
MRLRVRMTGQNTSHFDKDWARISEIEEYRLDWSGQVCDRAHCGGERGQPRRFVNIAPGVSTRPEPDRQPAGNLHR